MAYLREHGSLYPIPLKKRPAGLGTSHTGSGTARLETELEALVMRWHLVLFAPTTTLRLDLVDGWMY
jgi:hypothetical protein